MSSTSTDSTTNNPSSTLNSIFNTATSTIQSAVGAITGNKADKQQAADRQAGADTEREASRAGAKAGPVNLSTTGEATVDNKDRRDGQWDETIGSVKKAVGNVLGYEPLKGQGARQEQEGQGQKATGQLKDFASSTADRVTGTIGSGIASALGNQDAKADFQKQHDQGKTTIRGLQAEAEKTKDDNY